jgi:hypothetical protein
MLNKPGVDELFDYGLKPFLVKETQDHHPSLRLRHHEDDGKGHQQLYH